jgi:hypothetical protein
MRGEHARVPGATWPLIASAVAAALVVTLAPAAAAAAPPALPPVNVAFDYQLGGAYVPDPAVRIVARDRHERPAPGRYTICYVNGFQTQPGERRWWRTRHPRLLLRDASGRPVVDEAWGEAVLDTSTAGKRRKLGRIVGRWIAGCAADGFSAVEPDNLDSWTRSRGRITAADNAAFARRLARKAHAVGLAIAQKNAAPLAASAARIGFDFAVVEECQAYHECGVFTRAYGSRVYEIEYADNGGRAGFERACAARGARISIVYRDRDLVPPGRPGHVWATC